MPISPTLLASLQIGLAVLLTALILIQNRGTGLGGVFGGEGSVYRTKRGAEKVIFFATVVVAALFLALAAVSIFLQR